MKIFILQNYDEISKKAFDIFKETITNISNPVIGFATGTTPIGLYNLLTEACKNNEISFKKVTTFNLDEYVGLNNSHNQSYAYFMHKYLFDNIDIKKENINLLNGDSGDLSAECDRYNALLNDNQIDLQILGLGSNGHIGFNEPGTSFSSVTHVVNLKDSTIRDNSRLFDNYDEVPKKAITMGIKNIMNAKRILLLVSGKNKAEAIRKFFIDDISEELPCSILKTHKELYVLLDVDAASLILQK